MKYDKEWLTNQIEVMGTETSENYPHEQMIDRKMVLEMVDQLDEPKKVIIPQFVADYIEKSKGWDDDSQTYVEDDSIDLFSAMDSDSAGMSLEVENYILTNMNTFARAWLDDGYEIEKEPLYYVPLGINRLGSGRAVYLSKPEGGVDVDWSDEEYIKSASNAEVYLFTEAEIKSIDERFWPFAVEVAE